MSNFYTAIVYVVIFSMCIMIATAHTNQLLSNERKKYFIITFIAFIFAISFEWLSMYLEQFSSYATLNIITVIVLFTLTPTIPILLSSALVELKYKKPIFAVLFLNFLMQLTSQFTHLIFYVNENNVYSRCNYYWLYSTLCFISVFILFFSAFRLSRKYRVKSTVILFFTLLLTVSGNALQVLDMNIYTIWISSSTTGVLLYTYYTSLISQTDALSSLLNKHCYDTKISKLKTDAVIIFFDINNLKLKNESLGYSYGDSCISKIGTIIAKNYQQNSHCYRIDSGKFCVIMTQNLDKIEILNHKFSQDIKSLRGEDENMPSVAFGYSNYYYSTATSNIKDTIYQAEMKMYENKKMLKNSKTFQYLP